MIVIGVDENETMIDQQRNSNSNYFTVDTMIIITTIKPALFMTAYFLTNLILTLHTKWLLSKTDFKFPWCISGLHILISGLGAFLVIKLGNFSHKFDGLNWWWRWERERKRDVMKILLFSTIYSVNIGMSNLSMKYVSLALHQVTRSGTPIVTLGLELLILRKTVNGWLVASLIPVVFGIVLTVLGEMSGFEASTLGLSLTVLGVVISSLKGVLSNLLMVGDDLKKMNPLELIVLLAPLATLQCLFTSVLTGEIGAIHRQYSALPFDGILVFGLVGNGCLAFCLNWISFTVNKETSALAMTVAGNVKQAVSIGLAVIIFNTPLTVLNGLGIFVTLIGGVWYR